MDKEIENLKGGDPMKLWGIADDLEQESHKNTMNTENDTSKPEDSPQQEAGEGCSGATCLAFFDLDAPRLRELLEDYVRDKRQIGKDLGLPEEERLHHRFQRRIICDLQRENRMMKMALAKVHERMQGPANNRRFMQIAGPARECLNLAKPFLPNSQDHG